jgi:cell division protein ZapA (FtsZ GTPase activity inhibitor)
MASHTPTLGIPETKPENKESKVEITLLGQRLVLKSSQINADVFKEIVQLATHKLDQAQARTKGAPAHQVALLALLDLAEEYVSAKKKTQDYKTEMAERSNQLLSLIEAEFQ